MCHFILLLRGTTTRVHPFPKSSISRCAVNLLHALVDEHTVVCSANLVGELFGIAFIGGCGVENSVIADAGVLLEPSGHFLWARALASFDNGCRERLHAKE